MKKKVKNNLSWGTTVFATIAGVVAFFLIFADAVHYTGLIFGSSFTGLQVALGYTVNDITVFNASAGIILGYVLPLVGACVALIGKGNKVLTLLASAMLLTGGVLLLCATSLLNGGSVGVPSLAAGPIAAGVIAILGGVTECSSFFFC